MVIYYLHIFNKLRLLYLTVVYIQRFKTEMIGTVCCYGVEQLSLLGLHILYNLDIKYNGYSVLYIDHFNMLILELLQIT